MVALEEGVLIQRDRCICRLGSVQGRQYQLPSRVSTDVGAFPLGLRGTPTLSVRASRPTVSLNLAKHNSASCIRPTPSGAKVKLRVGISAIYVFTVSEWTIQAVSCSTV